MNYMDRKSLDDIANEQGTDKGTKYHGTSVHGYAPIYETYLNKWRDDPISILEVGVCMEGTDGGHSINMWKEYFQNANIYTFDIVDMSNHPSIRDSERVKFFRGDQSVREDLYEMHNSFKNIPFHVILEDGLHEHKHQVISLGVLFQYVTSGGYYILEDISIPGHEICCIRNDETYYMIQQFKNTGKMVSEYLTPEEQTYLENNIESIEMYPDVKDAYCVAIIQKKK